MAIAEELAALRERTLAEIAAADTSAILQFGTELMQQWAVATPVRYVTTNAEVNIRKGPGDQFDTLETIAAGQQALVTGVNRDNKYSGTGLRKPMHSVKQHGADFIAPPY